MTRQQSIVGNAARVVSPIIVFAVLFLLLWKFEVVQKGTAFGIGAVMGLVDYFFLTWIMKRAR